MNSKQAEKLTGISKRNIRFYEAQGLIEPERNPENDYREYSEKDIERLKIIRGLRTIDVPLDLINNYFNGKVTLEQLSELQEKHLKEKQREVAAALNICKELHSIETLTGSNIDNILEEIDNPETNKSLFDEWKNDYKQVADFENKAFFYFYPEKTIETRNDMTIALIDYAEENNYKIEFIKEGLNPVFKLNGITYTASCANSSYNRISSVMYPEVFCQAENMNEIYTTPLNRKQKLMKLIHNWWGTVLVTIIFGGLFLGRFGISILKTPEFWISIIGIIALCTIAVNFRKIVYLFCRCNSKTSKDIKK